MGAVCASCADTCTGGCSDNCASGCPSQCTGQCRYGCGSICGGNCTAYCAQDCNNSCTGGCSGGCMSACSGYCSGTCSTYCGNNCTGGCKSGCSGCDGTCKGACNKTCDSGAQADNIALLSLNEKILASDINNIITAIEFEVVDRRDLDLANAVTFAQGDLLNAAKIEKIIDNLEQTGQTAAYSASSGDKVLKVLAEDLIQKIKNANNELVGLP